MTPSRAPSAILTAAVLWEFKESSGIRLGRSRPLFKMNIGTIRSFSILFRLHTWRPVLLSITAWQDACIPDSVGLAALGLVCS